MKSKLLIAVMAVALVMSVAVFPVDAAVSVKVEKVENGNIKDESVVNGKIVPEKTIGLASMISAEVTELNAKMGQYVKKGEKLVVFEDDQIKAQLKQAKAALDAAEANLERMKKGAGENDIKASLAGIKQAEASLKMAQAQHGMLLDGASKEDIKRAEESYNQAVASYKGVKESLELVKKIYNDKTSLKQQLTSSEMQFESSKKQLESAKKRYEQSKVNLEQAQVNLDQAKKEYNRMKDLYDDGVVTEKQFEMAESQYKNARLTVQNAKSAVANAEIAVEQAKISHKGAEESYNLTEESYNDPTQLKQQLDSAKTQVEISRANKEIAKANLEKVKKGAKEGEIESSLASVQQAEAALERTKANHAKLKEGASDEEIRASQAQVEQAEASLEQAQLRLEDTVISSPISGYVASVNTEKGQLISPGTPLINLVSLDPAFVRVDVSSDVLINIKEGNQVKVDLLAYEDLEKTGTIDMISPVRDQRTQLYPVKVKLENQDSLIKAGMFADVHFILSYKNNVTLIPTDAVIDLDGDPYVFVIENDKAVRKEIEIGLISQNKVEVKDGIEPEESIVIQGQTSLQDGNSVEVVN